MVLLLINGNGIRSGIGWLGKCVGFIILRCCCSKTFGVGELSWFVLFGVCVGCIGLIFVFGFVP